MGVISGAVAFALICTYLVAAADASIVEATWTGSETELYRSVYWEPNFGNLVILGDDAESQDQFKLFREQLNNTDIFLLQVSCGSEASPGEVCALLREHRYAVKSAVGGDNKLAGVRVPVEYEANDLTYLLQVLLGDKLSFLSTYSELKTQTSQEDSFIAYVVNTTSTEYLQLLEVWIVFRLPLFVVTQINTLPLSYRPTFKFSPKPLHLWQVRQASQHWLKFSYTTPKSSSAKDEPQTSFLESLNNFVDRLRFPIVATHDKAIEEQLEGTTFHRVYVFPAIGKGVDINTLVENVAKVVYTDFIFFIGERDTEVARRLFVTEDKKLPQIAVLPFGREEDIFSLEAESTDLSRETDNLLGILESFAKDTPRTGDPEDSHSPPLVTVMDTVFFYGIVKEKKTDDVLASFCLKGSRDCPGVAYEAMRDLMVALQREGILKQLSSLIAHVVECDSLDDITAHGFNSLPSYGLYNHTKDKWYRSEKELTKPFQALALLVLSSGLDDLIGLDISSTYSDEDYSPYYDDQEYSTPQTEDDHFALILKTLPTARLPKDSSLTNDNFDDHVRKFEKTVVVFYISWCTRSQLFLNHVVAAFKSLDTAAHNASLAVVKCEDWTDLCTRVGVNTFPTALIFTPDTLHTPTPLTHLDTPHILNALGQYPLESDGKEQLLELTPDSLPSLLGGDLATPLVVWADSHVTSDKKEAFRQVALRSKGQSEWSFAWIDSSRYTSLLTRMTQTEQLNFPTVLVLKLDKHEVYQYPVTEGQTVQEFSEGLETFLAAVASGDATPFATLVQKSWPPVQPPVRFPSEDPRFDDEDEPVPDQKALPFAKEPPPFDKEAPPPADPLSSPPPHHSSHHTEL